jgi:hypothetical protein
MNILIELTPEQISEVVSRELINLYDDMRKDNTLLMGTEWENEAALKSIKHIIEYYTTPTKFEEWMKEE